MVADAAGQQEDGSGYLLRRIYAVELRYVHRPPSEDDKALANGMQIEWDWRIQGEREFAVIFGVRFAPTEEYSHEIVVRMVGEFALAGEGRPTPALEDFCRVGATAIMYPFVRESIASLTVRPPVERSLLLPPQNVDDLMAGMKFEASTGARQLSDFPVFDAVAGGP